MVAAWARRGHQLKRQRVAPFGSVVLRPATVWKVNRYKCQGAGPALGAL